MPRKEPGLAARTRGRKLRALLLAGTGRGVKTRRERHRRRTDHPALRHHGLRDKEPTDAPIRRLRALTRLKASCAFVTCWTACRGLLRAAGGNGYSGGTAARLRSRWQRAAHPCPAHAVHAEPLSAGQRLFDVDPLTLARDNPDENQRELMNGPGHYREAERLRDEATSRGDFNPGARWCLELAKLRTAVAYAAATAQASGGGERIEVAGPWFSDITVAPDEQDRT
jgi:hypothetical protein